MTDERVAYNARQAASLWRPHLLPEPLRSLDPGSVEFAEAVSDLQKENGLSADGMLGPLTFAVLYHPSFPKTGVAVVDSLISVADAEAAAKVREVGGKNRGSRVEEYQRSVNLRPGDPWCSAFVGWCIAKSRSADKPPTWCSGSAVTTWQKGSRKAGPAAFCTPMFTDYRDRIEAGWIWVRAKDQSAASDARRGSWVQGHIGIVVGVDDIGFHTIEGNTNFAGSREGDGVYRKLHKWTDSIDIGRTVGWFNSSLI